MVTHAMMDLQSFNLLDHYTFLDALLQAVNTLASSQGYTLVKRRMKVSKKRVSRKTVLICNRSKECHTKSWDKKETITQKKDCPFDALIILEVDR